MKSSPLQGAKTVLEEKQQCYTGKTPLQQIGNRNEGPVFQRMPGVLQALDYEPQSLDVLGYLCSGA